MRYFYFMMLVLINQPLYAKAAETNAMTHSELLRVIGGLVLVLLFILALSWFLKRLNSAGFAVNSKGFKPIASMSVGAKERLMVIQVGERYLLIGVGAGSITTLADFGDQLPCGFDSQGKAPFSEILKSVLGKT